jgi:hypothetical protein
MASTDARPVPKKNTAFRHYFAIRDNTGALVTSWAGQDTELSQDGGAFADATNEATEIGTSGVGYIDLTATEMNNDAVIVKVSVTNTDALTYVITLFPEEGGDIRVDATHVGGDAIQQTGGHIHAFDDQGNAIASSSALATVDSNVDDILVDTGTTIPNQISGLNDLSAAQVNAEVDAAISDAALATASALATVDANVDAILLDTAEIGTAGAGLTEAGGTGDHLTAVAWNAAWDAEVQSEVQDAIEANHLDHLLAATYDPASKPGAADALFNEMVESDGGVSRFTANALEQAPSGGSGLSLSDTVTDGQTAGTVGKALENAIDFMDASISGLNNLSASEVNAEVDAALADYDAVVPADLPANFADLSITPTTGLVDVDDSTPIDANVTQLDGNAIQQTSGHVHAFDDTGAELATQSSVDTVDSNVDAILVDTGTTIPSQISGLNDISPAEVNAEVDTALADYDAPTKTELDTAESNIRGADNDTLKTISDQVDGASTFDPASDQADGVTYESIAEAILAFVAGDRDVTDNGTTRTIVFNKQDGTTAKITMEVSEAAGSEGSTATAPTLG